MTVSPTHNPINDSDIFHTKAFISLQHQRIKWTGNCDETPIIFYALWALYLPKHCDVASEQLCPYNRKWIFPKRRIGLIDSETAFLYKVASSEKENAPGRLSLWRGFSWYLVVFPLCRFLVTCIVALRYTKRNYGLDVELLLWLDLSTSRITAGKA